MHQLLEDNEIITGFVHTVDGKPISKVKVSDIDGKLKVITTSRGIF
jgi:hypothetical protein